MSNNEVGEIYRRPWGEYQTLALESGFQVKILTILPGGRLSLQRHFQRTEHWVVVQGEPTLTIGDSKKVYHRDQVVYIPLEALHRIENLTDENCQLVEVQVGDYLGEDDIERIDDGWSRIYALGPDIVLVCYTGGGGQGAHRPTLLSHQGGGGRGRWPLFY